MPPQGVDANSDKCVNIASFDGDADRVVYHYFDEDGKYDNILKTTLCISYFQ